MTVLLLVIVRETGNLALNSDVIVKNQLVIGTLPVRIRQNLDFVSQSQNRNLFGSVRRSLWYVSYTHQ